MSRWLPKGLPKGAHIAAAAQPTQGVTCAPVLVLSSSYLWPYGSTAISDRLSLFVEIIYLEEEGKVQWGRALATPSAAFGVRQGHNHKVPARTAPSTPTFRTW